MDPSLLEALLGKIQAEHSSEPVFVSSHLTKLDRERGVDPIKGPYVNQ